MPNHVRNVLKFKHLKKTDIDFILNTIATPMEDADIFKDGRKVYAIDFDKIIPQPRVESDCPDDCKVNKDSHVMEDKDRPWFDWYAWNTRYWGTKWGAYDCYSKIGKSYITFVFSTAWSMPYPVIERLHLLGYEFELKYADEDWGSNCGFVNYEPDGTTGKMVMYHTDAVECCKNPEQFARRLWDTY